MRSGVERPVLIHKGWVQAGWRGNALFTKSGDFIYIMLSNYYKNATKRKH